MGFPVALFADEPPDEDLICAVCHDVMEAPLCCQCSHSFCGGCLEKWFERSKNCPSCRRDLEPTMCTSNGTMERLILKFQVRCANKQLEEASTEPSRQRRQLDDGNAADDDNDKFDCCQWTGKLENWKKHESECAFRELNCTVQGCHWVGTSRDLKLHMAGETFKHMELILNSKTKEIEKRLEAKFQKKYEDQKVALVEFYINSFCRQWMQHKPVALFDVCVYRSFDGTGNKLLFGIPGPVNSHWEGGLFPMLMIWDSVLRPPKCRFPPNFLHVNVYPSGTIDLTNLTLHDEDGWSPDISIPEILFSIQQLLPHHHLDSPAQAAAYTCCIANKAKYDKKCKDQAQQYTLSGDAFLASACEVFSERDLPNKWKLMDDSKFGYGRDCPEDRNRTRESPSIPSLSGSDNDCKCSCCAWGQSFWDSQREMRYFFGRGG